MKKNLLSLLSVSALSVILSACGGAPTSTGIMIGTGTGTLANAGCVALTNSIGFAGTNVSFISGQRIVAGIIPTSYSAFVPSAGTYLPYDTFVPYGGTYGEVFTANAGSSGNYKNSYVTDAQVVMNITPNSTVAAPVPTNTTSTTVTGNFGITGTVTLQPAALQYIQQYAAMFASVANNTTTGYNTTPTTIPATSTCVSDVAISMAVSGFDLYGGHIYLTLNNNTKQVVVLRF